MPTSYNHNQSWDQQQSTFGRSQQNPQQEEFDFSAVSGTSNDMSQTTFSYHPSQLQFTSNGNAPSGVMHHNLVPNQAPMERRAVPFGGNPAVLMKPGAFSSGTYSPGSNSNRNVEPYHPTFPNNTSDQLPWNNSSSFGFQKPVPNNTNFNRSGLEGTSEGIYIPSHISSSPGAMPDAFPQSSQQPSHFSIGQTAHVLDLRGKRGRSQVQDDAREEEQDNETTSDAKEGSKTKPGACGRCKSLKVKCEFKTETDPCKRCLNGGHDCIIPGRKKRRTPPKREHLLNQIREQAAQIKDLMSQLETSGASKRRRPSSITSDSFASSSGIYSPIVSPSSTAKSFPPSESPSDYERNQAVEDWIAKAKQSFAEFDVFIGIGGASMPQNYLVKEDLENSNSDGEGYFDAVDDEREDYDFTVEYPDEDAVGTFGGTLRHKSSASSFSTNGTGVAPQPRKKHSGGSKLAILPGGAVPFGLFGDLSLKTTPKKRGSGAEEVEGEEDGSPGIANTDFFRSTPAPETVGKRLANLQHPPLILVRGLITPKEAEMLFQIYFDNMNLSVSLLDPVLYTAQRTYYRSPFLFTVICAIASRFYSARPELYNQAMQHAQQAAGMALISGNKNVEMCSAYILLSLYPVPVKRWEDQRNWLYLGLAIRTATDLNLHLPTTAKPLNENHAREMLNRTRVWLNCFNLDRSTGSQYGRAPIISSSDYTASHSENWWKSSPYNMKNFDIHLCAYTAELRVMEAFRAKIYSDPTHPTGLNKEVDFERIASEADEEIKELGKKWVAILEHTDMTDPQNAFRTGLLELAYPYARLIALSYGFQHAFGKNYTDENPFLVRCLNAASDVVKPVLDELCCPEQRIYFRHGPEAQSVFVSFASAFLVKLLQPKFASYISNEKRTEIRGLVQRVVDLLGSAEIAVDDRHGPKLYSKFLKGLLAAPMARVDPITPPDIARKLRKPVGGGHEPTSEVQSNTFSHPSPTHSASLSPPARPTALSFDTFAPAGGLDPFAPDLHGTSNSLALHISGGTTEDGTDMNMSDFFQPSLPFDNAILESMQSLSDPSGWHDTTLPVDFNWNTYPFQPSLDMNFRTDMYNDQYMTGV